MQTVPRDARRAQAAIAQAAKLVRQPVPAMMPEGDLYARMGDRDVTWKERQALEQRAGEAAAALLRAAVKAERDARRAQESAIEALRHLNVTANSWDEIALITGLSRQGAHKRYRHVEAPLPQTTIDQALADA